MRINICFHNTQGLHNDAEVLKKALKSHTIDLTTYNELQLLKSKYEHKEKTHDVIIFLEHVHYGYIHLNSKMLFFPNIEWLNVRDLYFIKHYTATLCCKTKHSYVVLNNIETKCALVYTKFSSIDRYIPWVSKKHQCLHIQGVSNYKNTQVVLDTWYMHNEWPTLHIVRQCKIEFPEPIQVKHNIVLHQRKLGEICLCKLMNDSLFHICPSYCEGYGHYINEARSCNAVVISTDGYPMKELIDTDNGFLAQCRPTKLKSMSQGHVITTDQLADAVTQALNSSQELLQSLGEISRYKYVEDTRYFEKKISQIVND